MLSNAYAQIFEQSRFANETGAAIHLAPNANGILRRLGVFAEDTGANLLNQVRWKSAYSLGRTSYDWFPT